MRFRTLAVAAFMGALCSAALAQGPEEGRAEAFRRLRAEGVVAINAGNLESASASLAQADRLIPNHPGLTLLRAKLAAARDDLPAATALLDRYARFGLTADLADDEVLQRVTVENDFVPVARRLAANAQPLGRLEVVGSLDGPFLAEGVAWDPASRRLLISGVHGRSIMAVSGGGKLTRFLDPRADVDGVMGLAIDAPRNLLWAASAGLPQAKDLPEGRRGTAALLKIDLRSGRLLSRFDPPAGSAPRAFGDIALGADGAVYVSDAFAGEILRLSPGAHRLEQLVAPGSLASPQGLVVAPDGQRLVVSDYVTGLHVVQLSTGVVTPLAAPDDASLIGVDGLVRDGDSLIAIQNGVSPHRVVRLTMNAGFSAVERWEVLAANLPQMEEPTTGLVHEDELVFVARSQWTDFGQAGALLRDPPGPAIIARLKLR